MLKNIRHLLGAFRKKRDGSTKDFGVEMGDDCDSSELQLQEDQHQKFPAGFPEVIFVIIQSMTNDRRDMSLDYKLSGPYFKDIPNVASTDEEIFLPGSLSPQRTQGRGDIVLSKTACSAFATTNLDRLLRNLFVEQLVMCGQLTDQCVESAVRDAADLGYLVTVAEDACAAHSRDEHAKGLFGMKGFCRFLSTQDILQEIDPSAIATATPT
jgi:nicotinamidase-related amidase